MQEFFMDYGLWLLVALLVLIVLVFLLSGKRKADLPVESAAPPFAAAPPVADPAPAPLSIDPVAPTPVIDTLVAEPVPVDPVQAEPAPVDIAPTAAPASPPPTAAVAEPIPVSPAVTAPADEADDLLRLKGVGPKLKALLVELGVTRFDQIAAWSEADIAAIDARLGNFKGRPVRDQWVDQAKYLAAGDVAGFEARYGKL